MTGQSDWASDLATAVASHYGERPLEVQLVSVRAVSPDIVELIYSDPVDGDTMGIRIDSDSVRSAQERIRDNSIDELAFDLVYIGMCEPKAKDEFLPPDENGVRWLRLQQWLDEIS